MTSQRRGSAGRMKIASAGKGGRAGWWPGLPLSLALVFLAAGAGGIASAGAADFYIGLSRPWWAPPAWLFGPVWTVLYVLMAVSAWLVWDRGGEAARRALGLYCLQLALNAAWTWIFFAWRFGALALLEIVALLAAAVLTAAAFWRVRRAAGVLFLPYILWLVYAAALTAALWTGNPGRL